MCPYLSHHQTVPFSDVNHLKSSKGVQMAIPRSEAQCLTLLLFSTLLMSDSFVTSWTVACQTPLSIGFPRQEYWSGLPFLTQGLKRLCPFTQQTGTECLASCVSFVLGAGHEGVSKTGSHSSWQLQDHKIQSVLEPI